MFNWQLKAIKQTCVQSQPENLRSNFVLIASRVAFEKQLPNITVASGFAALLLQPQSIHYMQRHENRV